MEQSRETPVKPPNEYQPPQIEAELTDEGLAREVQYAGDVSQAN